MKITEEDAKLLAEIKASRQDMIAWKKFVGFPAEFNGKEVNPEANVFTRNIIVGPPDFLFGSDLNFVLYEIGLMPRDLFLALAVGDKDFVDEFYPQFAMEKTEDIANELKAAAEKKRSKGANSFDGSYHHAKVDWFNKGLGAGPYAWDAPYLRTIEQ